MPGQDDLDLIRQLYRQGGLELVTEREDGSPRLDIHDERIGARLQREMRRRRYVDDEGRLSPDIIAKFMLVHAEKAITEAWQADGGPANSVGLPLGGQITVAPAGDDRYEARFRSGSITITTHDIVTLTTSTLNVDFVGMECNVRQESSDEIYGVVGAIGPANRQIATYAFPGGDGTIAMGRDGERFWTTGYRLYSGPIQDITLIGSLIEHDDFTDVEGAARRIADTIVEKGGQLLGSLTGVPAEAVADNTWFRDGLAAGIGFILGDVFGMGDDPYPAQALQVRWEEIGDFGPPAQPPRTRGDDPKRIERWTHRLKLTGHDDGGDLGDYDLYFNIWVDRTTTERRSPVH